jgi:rubrerythrin
VIPQQLYEVFISFEERSADLYLDLSVHFMNDVELSWFWVEMAMEEKQHAGMLQYCKETGIFSNRLPDEQHIQDLAGLFKRLGKKVEEPGLSLDEAFAVAIDLECSEINEIYRNLTQHIEGPTHVVRKKIELSMDNHFERLRNSARRFGVSAAVTERLAKLTDSAA